MIWNECILNAFGKEWLGQWRMLYNEDSSRTFKYQLKI